MCDSFNMGGLSSPGYATVYNTPGMGDVIPCGINTAGSGDRFDNCKKKQNKSVKTVNQYPDLNPPLVVYVKS